MNTILRVRGKGIDGSHHTICQKFMMMTIVFKAYWFKQTKNTQFREKFGFEFKRKICGCLLKQHKHTLESRKSYVQIRNRNDEWRGNHPEIPPRNKHAHTHTHRPRGTNPLPNYPQLTFYFFKANFLWNAHHKLPKK